MNYNEIAAICRSMIAELLGKSEDTLDVHVWDGFIYSFAASVAQQRLSEQEVTPLFQEQVRQFFKQLGDLRRYYHESLQRHHDLFVCMKREGRLPPEKEDNYQLAIAREKVGLVKPLED